MSKYRELVRNGVISRKVRNQAAEPAALQSLIEANFATTNITEVCTDIITTVYYYFIYYFYYYYQYLYIHIHFYICMYTSISNLIT